MASVADVLRAEEGYFSRPEKNWSPGWMGTPGRTAQEDAYEMQRANAAQAISEAYNPAEDLMPVGKVAKALHLGLPLAMGAMIPMTPGAGQIADRLKKSFSKAAFDVIEMTGGRKGKVFGTRRIPGKDLELYLGPNTMETRGLARSLKSDFSPPDEENFWGTSYHPLVKEQEAGAFPAIHLDESTFKRGVAEHEGGHQLLDQLRPSTADMLRKHYLKRGHDLYLEGELAGIEPSVMTDYLDAIQLGQPRNRWRDALHEIFAGELQGKFSPGPASRHLLSPLGRALGQVRFPKREDFLEP